MQIRCRTGTGLRNPSHPAIFLSPSPERTESNPDPILFYPILSIVLPPGSQAASYHITHRNISFVLSASRICVTRGTDVSCAEGKKQPPTVGPERSGPTLDVGSSVALFLPASFVYIVPLATMDFFHSFGVMGRDR